MKQQKPVTIEILRTLAPQLVRCIFHSKRTLLLWPPSQSILQSLANFFAECLDRVPGWTAYSV